ncbi:hypothetical protein [Chromobacterium sp. Beijing]|uniref:hypothetical protein n=1 Tax=Chromobacterium sp. Beijing TaxID=2735795 RepID=UPI001F47E77F|nr:hypothetical protein [Chromobacterium sp. Beijing]UJB30244.1 hypothetical protein HQN78_03745 [Chromobacterium sp. Beijing]
MASRILGPDGQPISTGLLKTTIATPTTTGVRQIVAGVTQGWTRIDWAPCCAMP